MNKNAGLMTDEDVRKIDRPNPRLFADSDFRKSGWCGNRPRCVEVAIKPEGVAVRNSTDPTKVAYFTKDEWSVFIRGVKSDEFNI